jgi:hypothetical protein
MGYDHTRGSGSHEPCAAHTGRDTVNDNDNIYDDSMLLKVTQENDGYLGVIDFAVDSDRDGV